jgi:hypothetical protein
LERTSRELLFGQFVGTQAQHYVLQGAVMKETSDDKMAIAFAWYRPEQWHRIRDISSDAEDMDDSYLEWLQLAEEKLNELQSSGLRVEKIEIDSEQLIRWCNEQGLDINGKSRSKYAAAKLGELDENRSLILGPK